ncbi:MAG: bifunctional tRNA (5-methylaminomethyl-2-thiouridine)(34)-methyltransferase MnmD/FAD-dependent 5-carboxymethylaminomethyl-2-thiouridine(34) oxidoreductase MnmC [Burkholderiales bacterium]
MPSPHDIEWTGGQPRSKIHGDVFFSKESGLEETRHVFLQGNELSSRWAQLRTGDLFVIGETGFGTGLNFLAAWQLWNQIAPKGRLHVLSFELHPLSRDSLQRVHNLWPELSGLSAQFLARYGDLSWGWHRFAFQGGEIMLTLVVGDARQCMPRTSAQADAWFLDGFSPARNPELWGGDILAQIARLSRPQATFATYTCAGAVQRGLRGAGFMVEKKKGFGRKREMMQGFFNREGGENRESPPERHAIVLGGGIAGCSASWSLAVRGWKVTLLEAGAEPAEQASGNPQAALHIRLPKSMLPAHEIALLGYQYSLRLCDELLGGSPGIWQQCGALQLDHASRRVLGPDILTALDLPGSVVHRVSQDEAAKLCGIPVQSGGLYFPRSGWLHGPSLCHRLASHPVVKTQFNCRVEDVLWSPADRRWSAKTFNGEVLCAPVLVVANSHDAAALRVTAHLPLHRVGGQITLPPATPRSMNLRSILCGEGLITPSRNGFHTLGATYKHERRDQIPALEENITNLKMLSKLSQEMYQALDLAHQPEAVLGARVAFRSTCPDRTPIAGRLTGENWEGLFASLAHGSRGFATAPLAGELIASQVTREPAPLPRELIDALAPDRFVQPNGNMGKHEREVGG